MIIDLLESEDLDERVQKQISSLYKQLNSEKEQRTLNEILEKNNHVCIAVCKENDDVLGIALLAMYKVISGHRGIVEDVVVNDQHRGRGIGRKLMEKLLEEAKARHVDDLLLFSGHHRTAAINLYKSIGFTLRESGVYNMKIG